MAVLTSPAATVAPTFFHLKVLYEAGLLAKERRGTWIYYRLIPERIEALREALTLPRKIS